MTKTYEIHDASRSSKFLSMIGGTAIAVGSVSAAMAIALPNPAQVELLTQDPTPAAVAQDATTSATPTKEAQLPTAVATTPTLAGNTSSPTPSTTGSSYDDDYDDDDDDEYDD